MNVFLCFFSAICQSPSLTVDVLEEKIMIINFLARVMHGKQLGKLLQQGTKIGLKVSYTLNNLSVIAALKWM